MTTEELTYADELDEIQLVKAIRLAPEIRDAAALLGRADAALLVKSYYAMQEERKRAHNQARALFGKTWKQTAEPANPVVFIARDLDRAEQNNRLMLQAYAEMQPAGQWALSIYGIGPVITSGLLAHIDIEVSPTVGHIWRFAGLDPTRRWLGREGARAAYNAAEGTIEERVRQVCEAENYHYETAMRFATTGKDGEPRALTADNAVAALARRPWNADLKVLAFKIGDCFIKFRNRDADVYGHFYDERKAYEIARNERGGNAETAARILASGRYTNDTVARRAYLEGRLPDGQIHARARRWMVKLFLAHFHHVMYEAHFGTPPPKPYILTQQGGHAHEITPPNWP